MTIAFKMYGSLIGLKMTNSTTGSLTPKSVRVGTAQFGSRGSANLTALDAKGYPTWTGSGENFRNYTISGLTLTPGQTRIAYIWGKQEAAAAQSIDLGYRDASYWVPKLVTAANLVSGVLTNSNGLFDDGNSYRFAVNISSTATPVNTGNKDSFIFTESYLGTSSAYSVYELYNTANPAADGFATTLGIGTRNSSNHSVIERRDNKGNLIASSGTFLDGVGNSFQYSLQNRGADAVNLQNMISFGGSSTTTFTGGGPNGISGYLYLKQTTAWSNTQPREYLVLLKNGVPHDCVKVTGAYNTTRKRKTDNNTPKPFYDPTDWISSSNTDNTLGQKPDIMSCWSYPLKP